MIKSNVPADYVPSSGEIDNIVYITLKSTIGWPMRQCDLAMITILCADPVGDR